MKTKHLIIFVLITVMLSACTKIKDNMFDKKRALQPENVSLTILSTPGDLSESMVTYIIDNRDNMDPGGYHGLKNLSADTVRESIVMYLPEDILTVCDKYLNKYYTRNDDKIEDNEVWESLEIGVSESIYKISPQYGEALLRILKNYCENILTGTGEDITGERNILHEEGSIIPLIEHNNEDTGDDYIDAFHEYYFKIAQEGNLAKKTYEWEKWFIYK